MAKILLIDDAAEIRQFVAAALASAGHEIVLAGDGRAGLEAFQSVRPDLVITDLVMPGIEGIELIIELRKQEPDLKIVAMSGVLHSSAYFRLARQLGAVATLRKPFTAEDLFAMVNTVLGEPRE